MIYYFVLLFVFQQNLQYVYCIMSSKLWYLFIFNKKNFLQTSRIQ